MRGGSVSAWLSGPRVAKGILLLGLAFALMAFPSRVASGAGLPESPAGLGSYDFIQYWAAHKLMLAGENPYDPRLMLAVERAQGWADPEPQMCWNPPWLIALLSPILGFSLRISARLWLCLNLVLATLVGLVVVSTYRGRLAMRPVLLAAFFLFQPVLVNLGVGQIGMLYAVAVAGFLHAASRNRDVIAGIMLVPLSVKPHLVYLVLPLLAYWMVARRRWRVLVGLMVAGPALIAWTWLSYPSSIRQWVITMSTTPPMDWVVGTLVGVARLLFHANGSAPPSWPLVVIPGLTAAIFCGWLLWRRPAPNLRRLLPPVLALSLFTAPYGWAFDQCQLLLIQVGLVALAEQDSVPRPVRRSVWMAVASVQIAWTVEQLLGYRSLHHFFWSSLALFVVWEYGMRKLGEASSLPDHA